MRKKLIELLENDKCPIFMVFGDNMEGLADYLIANGVTIPVRCKDCKHYVTAPYYALDHDDPKDTKICRNPNLDYDTECGDQWVWMNPDDFCSDGERST